MKDAVIVGAGLAGLNCATILECAGLDVALLEAADAPGGRVRTDRVDGFLLDRGFQVLLTAYPEAQTTFDYAALHLQPLKPGALVWKDGRFHRFADPFREPLAAIKLALDPIVPLGDKLRVAQLRSSVSRGTVAELFSHEETTTRSYLDGLGFSAKIIDAFFQPFFGGVFLERDLATSSRYFEFLFRMFSAGTVSVPASGMQALPNQLAARLKPGTLLTGCLVTTVERTGVTFSIHDAAGRTFAAKSVILATAEFESRQLLQGLGGLTAPAPVSWNKTTTFYFAADEAPLDEAILTLNGEGDQAGPVNNAVVMSAVSPSYAPAGKHLVSVSVIGDAPSSELGIASLERKVRQHLKLWFGPAVDRWRFLKAYPIEYALPLQQTAAWEKGNPRLNVEGAYRAGDFVETASIQGSLASGRRAAETLLADAGVAL